MSNAILITIFLSFLPISELRGAIPFAVANGIGIIPAAALSIFCNALVCPVALFFLHTLHNVFYKIEFYRVAFDKFVEKARKKVKNGVEKYGMWGICVFVAIPFPLTGAWTGTVGGWILGLQKRKLMLATLVGVIISGTIVSLVTHFGVQCLDFMIKKV